MDTSTLHPNPSVVSFIVIHHSLTKDGATVNWDAIRRFHTSWRFGGEIITAQRARELQRQGLKVESPWKDIGYHYGIERVGEKYEVMLGRELNVRGAHVAEANFNHRSIGVCLIGNFDLAVPPVEQWDLAVLVVRRLRNYLAAKSMSIPLANVIGHGEAQALAGVPAIRRKSCPGRLFDMDRFRENVEEPSKEVA